MCSPCIDRCCRLDSPLALTQPSSAARRFQQSRRALPHLLRCLLLHHCAAASPLRGGHGRQDLRWPRVHESGAETPVRPLRDPVPARPPAASDVRNLLRMPAGAAGLDRNTATLLRWEDKRPLNRVGPCRDINGARARAKSGAKPTCGSVAGAR